jgi:hypothetical protein
MIENRFGRKFSPDDRDQGFLMRRRLAAAAAIVVPNRKTHRLAAKSLDQVGGTCVGHAWSNFLRCAPIQTNKGAVERSYEIYDAAILVDQWTENDNGDRDFGTSVRAGAEAVTASGRLKSYVWAFELQPVIEWIGTQGPVVMGTNWYSSMMRTDAEGILRITPTAYPVGGHGWLLRGIWLSRGLARGENSWSDEWGDAGGFWIPLRDLERLIHEDGEACSAIEQKLQAKAVIPPPQQAAA